MVGRGIQALVVLQLLYHTEDCDSFSFVSHQHNNNNNKSGASTSTSTSTHWPFLQLSNQRKRASITSLSVLSSPSPSSSSSDLSDDSDTQSAVVGAAVGAAVAIDVGEKETVTISKSGSGSRILTKIIEESIQKSTISIEEYIQNANREHNLQFQSGKETFGCSSSSSSDNDSVNTSNNYIDMPRLWSDEDFITYSVKEGHAGPSEMTLQNGNIIYETRKPILSPEECQEYIQAATQTMQSEAENESASSAKPATASTSTSTSTRTERSNSELGEARLSKLPPDAKRKLKLLLQNQLYPMLTSQFGDRNGRNSENSKNSKSNSRGVRNLTVYDGLILGHIAPSQNQPVHRDASLLTINIPLSSPGEDFNGGGGTYIEGLLQHSLNDNDNDNESTNPNPNHNAIPLCIEKGKAISHSSGIMHAGMGIREGQRWVMVLFLIDEDEAQVARRCHAEGLYAMRSNQLHEATVAFHAGLNYAPKDHLLHMGIGQIASIHYHSHLSSNSNNINNNNGNTSDENDNDSAYYKDMELLSMDCLAKASTYYPPSHKAGIALGKILLTTKRRPRAALRRFDAVLAGMNMSMNMNKSMNTDTGTITNANTNARDVPVDLIEGAFLPLKAQAWDARVHAARCAIICCEEMNAIRSRSRSRSISRNHNSEERSSTCTSWSNRARLEEAIERIQIAMIPVPNDENLHYMMSRARELQSMELEYDSE